VNKQTKHVLGSRGGDGSVGSRGRHGGGKSCVRWVWEVVEETGSVVSRKRAGNVWRAWVGGESRVQGSKILELLNGQRPKATTPHRPRCRRGRSPRTQPKCRCWAPLSVRYATSHRWWARQRLPQIRTYACPRHRGGPCGQVVEKTKPPTMSAQSLQIRHAPTHQHRRQRRIATPSRATQTESQPDSVA
jgi:hypothetical protein